MKTTMRLAVLACVLAWCACGSNSGGADSGSAGGGGGQSGGGGGGGAGGAGGGGGTGGGSGGEVDGGVDAGECTASGWTLETPSLLSTTSDATLAFGRDGTLHAVFNSGGSPIYATRRGTSWTAQPVNSGGKFVVQGDGGVVLMTGSQLFRAQDDGGLALWTTFSFPSDYPRAAFALDPGGLPHVITVNQGTLIHSTLASDGGWDSTELLNGVIGLSAADIALSDDGKTAVCWRDQNGISCSAHSDGGISAEAPVGLGGAAQSFNPRVLFDPQSQAHVTYESIGAVGGQFTLLIEHATLPGGQVEAAETYSGYQTAAAPELAISASGVLHVLYQVNLPSRKLALRHAQKAPGGTWQVETVDCSVSANFGKAIAIDPSGVPWILYSHDLGTNSGAAKPYLAHP